MTELVFDLCNSSRSTLPAVAGLYRTADQQFDSVDVLNRIVLQSVLLLLLRYIAPPCVIFLMTCKLWHVYVHSSRDVTCPLPLPPGAYGLPLLGETIYLLLNGKSFFVRKRKLYGNIYRTHVFGKPTIRVIGADNVRQILRGENSLVTTQWPESTRILLGKGSLADASGDSHIARKRAIMKSFSFEALAQYVPVIQEVTQGYVHSWLERRRILGYPEFKTLNFDLSCRLLLGVQMHADECESLRAIFDVFTSNIFCLPIDVRGSGFRKAKDARDKLLHKIDSVVQERISNGVSQLQDSDVLSVMLRSNTDSEFPRDEIKNTCLELLFAGHGTSSTAASQLVYELAKHPDVRAKIREEMDAHGILGEHQEVNGTRSSLTFQTLNKLAYLNNVVREVLRISPPVGGGFRKALKTFEIGGFQIPKDWSITYSIRDTHETLDDVTDGHVFNPDRWDHCSGHELQFKYLPFGGGRRACAGKDLARLMLKIFAIELLQSCQWELENDNTTFKTFPVPSPTDDLPLVFTKRI